MAVYSQTRMSIAVDTLELAGFAHTLDLSATAEVKDITTFASGGWKGYAVGLRSQMFNVSGFQDYALTGVDVTFPVSGLGGANVYTIGPTGGRAAADPAFFGAGRLTDYRPLKGAVGEMGEFGFGFTGDGRVVRGQYLHPSAARTASGSGTACTFTTPTATDTLFASFHVLSVTGRARSRSRCRPTTIPGSPPRPIGSRRPRLPPSARRSSRSLVRSPARPTFAPPGPSPVSRR